jgi:Spy/CpxP family protein refolding chaperone
MIAANADEALVVKQVDRVESIRAHMNKTRTLMLLRMRQVLTPQQRVKLNQLYEQWQKDHRSRGKH